MKAYLNRNTNKVMTFGPGFHKYFILHYNGKNGVFQFAEDRIAAIERENQKYL